MTVTASKYARAENDLYQTEPWATEALLRHFPVHGLAVWEPAAGNHLIADVLRDSGATVHTSDIAIYDRIHNEVYDFLKPQGQKIDAEAIITNPPYGKGNRDAVRFAEYALTRCDGMVALLLTAKFDFGNTRTHLFRDNLRFCAKIALMDRLSWTLDGATGTEDHAWFVWGGVKFVANAPKLLYAGKKP